MADIRIKDLPESASLEAGDYVAVDSAGSGTRRFLLNDLIKNIGAPEYVVNVNDSGESDKTLSEILSAISDGYVPVVNRVGTYFRLSKVTDTGVTFTNNDDPTNVVSIRIISGGTVIDEGSVTSSQVTNASDVTGANVTAALNNIAVNVSTVVEDVSNINERVTDLEEHPIPIVDETLTQSGQAADAKVTGDVKSDVKNIRVGGEWSFQVNGGSSNTIKISLQAGLEYVITNQTAADINVNALKADGTDVNILNGLYTGGSITFNPTEDYVGLRGWVVESGTVTVNAYGYSDVIANLNQKIGTIEVGEWTLGGVSSGIETNLTTRIKSKRVRTGDVLSVRVFSPYYFGVSFYDKNGQFIRETNWMQGEHQFARSSDEYFVQIVMRHATNREMTVDESANIKIVNGLYDLTQSVVELYESIGKGRPNVYSGARMPSHKNTFSVAKKFIMSYESSNTSQDIETYGDYLFVGFSNPEFIRVYSLLDNSLLADMNVSVNHAASMQFSNEYYDSGDDFPLLYVGGGRDNTVYVIRINHDTSWTATVVKTLSIPNSLGYYLSPNVDGNTLYLYGYTGDSITSGNMKLVKCDLANITEGTGGTFTPKVLTEVEAPYLGVYQGHKYIDGNLYVGFSNTQSPFNPRLYGISASTGDVVTTVDLSPYMNEEFEGVCFRVNGGEITWFVSGYFSVLELNF